MPNNTKYQITVHAMSAYDNSPAGTIAGSVEILHSWVTSLVTGERFTTIVVTLDGYSVLRRGTVSGYKDIDIMVVDACVELMCTCLGCSSIDVDYIEYEEAA